MWIGGTTLDYAALTRAGNAIVAALGLTAPAPTSAVVAVIGARAIETYAAIHGCLRAGITYVPINPRWPADRVARILARARPDAVLLSPGVAPPPGASCRTIAYDAATAHVTITVEGGGEATPDRAYDPAGLAYIMFTSGSTGEPKGVPVLASSVADYRAAIHAIAPFDAADRVIQTVELTFDLSVHDMVLAWAAGAMLVVVPEASAPLGPRFVRDLAVTRWLSVPSVAAQSKNLRLLKPGSMPTLRTSFFCGEALPTSLARSWLEAAPATRLLNIYGPTEATIAFSAFDATDIDAVTAPVIGDVVPLGFPIGDQRMRLDPTGEIQLSGSQLSPGYLGDPVRTAAAFTQEDGERWYRTGDRGAFDAVTGYSFLGRLDAQIKLRGYRVELGDIESALRRASGNDLVAAIPVRDVAPSVHEGLVAVIAGSAETDVPAIEAALRQLLPPYMLPERILLLPAMPKNANDKVDRLELRRLVDASPK